MVKFIIIALFLVPVVLKAQQPLTFTATDTITYRCYQKGEWEKLISTAKQAIGENIDYKRLRQRLGYAYFARADYYSSQLQYEKALAFDEYDPDTREYLYYCALNTGNLPYARILAEKLSPELRKKLGIEVVKPIDAIDLEYNYKSNNSQTRTNPTYLRAGLRTQLGYRIQLYQSVSNYQQKLDSVLTKQPEYFALLSWSVTSMFSLDAAYHYLNTSVNGYKIPENLVFAALSARINRFTLGAAGSILSSSTGNTSQVGILADITFPGKAGFYLKSSLTELVESGMSRTILSAVSRIRLNRRLCAEGSVTLGNLKNYNDNKALYVYNSVDPTTFRTGMTLFWLAGKNTTFFVNYTFDKKQIKNTLINYNQQSISGGIIWKL